MRKLFYVFIFMIALIIPISASELPSDVQAIVDRGVFGLESRPMYRDSECLM